MVETELQLEGYLEVETTATVEIISVEDNVVEIWPPDGEPVFLRAGDTLRVHQVHKVDVNSY